MREIKIEINGIEARLVDGQWRCGDKDMARRLRVATKTALDPMTYYPDRNLAIAEHIANFYRGKVTHVDPVNYPKDAMVAY